MLLSGMYVYHFMGRKTIAVTEKQPRTTQDNWMGEVWYILAVENLIYKRNDRLRTGRELGCSMRNNSNRENPTPNIQLYHLLHKTILLKQHTILGTEFLYQEKGTNHTLSFIFTIKLIALHESVNSTGNVTSSFKWCHYTQRRYFLL